MSIVIANTEKKLIYPSWPDAGEFLDGYTIMLPVPHDLPVFTRTALQTLRRLNLQSCLEILLVPDQNGTAIDSALQEFQLDWVKPPIRKLDLGQVENLFAAKASGHGKNWMQLVRAIGQTRSKYIIWHDADAFILQRDFFEFLHNKCAEKQLACLGADRVWNHDFWCHNGYDRLNATWELTMDVRWVRQWSPHIHLGTSATINGEKCEIDTLIAAQLETEPERLSRVDCSDSYIHFNYVTASYRLLQAARGSFEDDYFRILLIRLLTDAFDNGDEQPVDLPTILSLQKGITDPTSRVTYRSDRLLDNFSIFRQRLQRLLESDYLATSQIEGIESEIEPFDEAFGGSLFSGN